MFKNSIENPHKQTTLKNTSNDDVVKKLGYKNMTLNMDSWKSSIIYLTAAQRVTTT